MNDKEKLQKVKELLAERIGCLCGSRESCESCNPYSAANRLRDNILKIINGPKRPMAVEDYSKTYTLSAIDLMDGLGINQL